MRRRIARQPNWLPAVLYALALHGAVIALLVVGFRIVSRDEVSGEAIQATVIREPVPEAKPEPPKPDPELIKREAERKQREAEAQRLAQERQQQEVERQKQVEEKRKQEEEGLRLEAEKEKKKKEEEKKKTEETQRRKQEEADKRKREEEQKKIDKQRQQQTEQALREQLEAEEKARATARAARRAPEADKYKAAIRQRVERHWVRPSSSRKGLQCTVRVRLIPGGEVLEASVVRSSGDATFDRSVENAVRKASPLPLPEDAEMFEQFRDIEFIFRPED